MEEKVHSLKKTARFAGLLYLIWVLTAIYGILYVPSKTIVPGDAVATSAMMLANEFIFRTGIVNGILSSIVWILTGMTLYRLFKHENEGQAKLLVVLVSVQIPRKSQILILDSYLRRNAFVSSRAFLKVHS